MIDERVVAMRFDNQQFEKKARQTMETCRELRESTNMDGVAEEFQTIGKAAKKSMNFRNPAKSVGLLSKGLTAMGRVARSVFSVSTFPLRALSSGLQELGRYTRMTLGFDIADSLVHAGKQVVQAFTIQPVKAGWSEYELKMDSIKTIMTGTEKTFSKMMETKSPGWVYDEEEHLGYVKNALEELNRYADDTIYNFQEMTRSIGKFTNAGVELDTSVSAIKGIANLAAYSGQGSQQANMAYYNLSQALGMGYLGTRDWMSIENANMASLTFKQTLVDLGVAMGTLEKQGDKILVAGNKKVEVTAERLRDTLSEKWVTNDVLLAALQIFSGDELNSEVVAALDKLTHEEAEALIKLGQDAKESAQQVRTFSKMWDALREAAQSGWAISWELIVGDSKESLEFWTGLNERFSAILGKQAEERNNVLREWRGMQQKEDGTWEKVDGAVDGRTVMIEGLNNVLDITETLFGAIGDAWDNMFGKLTGRDLLNLTTRFRDFSDRFKTWLGDANDSESRVSKIRESMEGLFSVFKIGKTAFSEMGKRGWNILKQLMPDFDKVMSKTAPFRNWIKKVADQFEKDRSFKNLAKNITDGFTKVFGQVRAKLSNKYAKYSDIMGEQGLGGVISQIKDDLKTKLAEWGIDITPIENFVNSISGYFTTLRTRFTEITNINLDNFSEWWTKLKNTIRSIGKKGDTEGEGEAAAEAGENAESTLDKVVSVFSNLKETVTSFISWAREANWEQIGSDISGVVFQVGGVLSALGFGTLAVGAGKMVNNSAKAVKGLQNAEVSIGGIVDVSTKGGLTGVLDSAKSGLSKVLDKTDKMGKFLLEFGAGIALLAEGMKTISEIPEEKLLGSTGIVALLEGLIAVFDLGEQLGSSAINKKFTDWVNVPFKNIFKSGETVVKESSYVKGQSLTTAIAFITEMNTLVNAMKEMDALQESGRAWSDYGLVAALRALMSVFNFADSLGGSWTSKLFGGLSSTLQMGSTISFIGQMNTLINSVIKIAEVDPKRVQDAKDVVAELRALMSIFNFADSFGGSFLKATTGLASTMQIGSAVSFILQMNTLVNSIVELAKIDEGQLNKAKDVVAELRALMSIFNFADSFGGGFLKATTGLVSTMRIGSAVSFILQMNTLVNSIVELAKIDEGQLNKAKDVVAELRALMSIFNFTDSLGGGFLKATTGLVSTMQIGSAISFILQMKTLVGSIVELAKIDENQLNKAKDVVAELRALMSIFNFTDSLGGGFLRMGFGALTSTLQIGDALSFMWQMNALVEAIVALAKIDEGQLNDAKDVVAELRALMSIFNFVDLLGGGFIQAGFGALSSVFQVGSAISFMIQMNTLVNSIVELAKIEPSKIDKAKDVVSELSVLVEAYSGLGQLINKSLAPESFSEGLNEILGPLSSLLSTGGLLVGLAGLIVGVKLLGEMEDEKLSKGIDSIIKLSGIVTAFSIIIGVFSKLGMGGSIKGAVSASIAIAAFTVIIGAILYGLSWLTELDPELLGRIEEGAKTVRAIFEGVGQILAGIVAPIASIFQPETVTLEDGTEQVINLQDQLHQLGEIGSDLDITGFNNLMDAVEKVQEIANIKINRPTGAASWLAGETSLFEVVSEDFDKFGKGIASFGTSIESTNLERVKEGVGAIQTIADSIQMLRGLTGGDLIDLVNLLGFQWNDDELFNFEQPTDWSRFIDFFTGIAAPINEGISEGALSIDSSPIITAIVTGITNGSDQIRAAITSVLGGIDVGSGDGTADSPDLGNVVDEATKETENALDRARAYLSQLGLGDVLPDMSDVTDSVTSAGTEMVDVLREAVGGEEGGFLDTLNGLFGLFKTGADANKDDAHSAGSELSNGALSGAKANTGKFFGAGFADGLNYLMGFKSATRVGSPSKAMIEMMGYIADGFELGQDRYGIIFTQTGEEEADAYLRAMRERLEPLSLAMAEGIDTTPVIRPVIDMSNIDYGMQQMRGAFGRGYNIPLTGGIPSLVGHGNVPLTASPNPNQNGSGASKIVDAVTSRIDKLQDAIENLEMVLDSGELVAGIASKMDKSLGVRAAKARRRG